MEFTYGQQLALDLALKTEDPLFITGPGGTGKTVVLNEIVRRLRLEGRNPKMVAYTGLAAQHIRGTTLARMLGIGLAKNCATVKYPDRAVKATKRSMKGVTDLIIDEVSMLSGDYLELTDMLVREALKCQGEAFGGIRVIYCGDFLQLPPIHTSQDPQVKWAWAFQYPAFQQVRVVQLSRSMRQAATDDVRILNQFRQGMITAEGADFLTRAKNQEMAEPVELHTHNALVNEINSRKLAELPGRTYHYETGFRPGNHARALESAVPVGAQVSVKIGAPVIVLVNKPEGGYYNGTQGRVINCRKHFVEIEVAGKGTRRITPHAWEVELGGDTAPGKVTGMPLKLGWAATIHKCQGMTLDRIRTDLSKCWEPGHAYVALSRASKLSNVHVVEPPKKFHTDPHALAYIRSLPQVGEET